MQKNMKVHFSSKTEEWATPQGFFNELNKEFHLTLDVCATHENRKCTKYFNKSDDGLSKNWDDETIWMNPPYGREIGQWIKKASEARGGGRGLSTSGSYRYQILPRIHLQESARHH